MSGLGFQSLDVLRNIRISVATNNHNKRCLGLGRTNLHRLGLGKLARHGSKVAFVLFDADLNLSLEVSEETPCHLNTIHTWHAIVISPELFQLLTQGFDTAGGGV